MAVTLTVETEIARAEQVRVSREQQQTRSPSIRRSVGACQVHSDKNKIDTRVRERLWPLSSVNRFIYWLSTGAWARIEINGRCGRCDATKRNIDVFILVPLCLLGKTCLWAWNSFML